MEKVVMFQEKEISKSQLTSFQLALKCAWFEREITRKKSMLDTDTQNRYGITVHHAGEVTALNRVIQIILHAQDGVLGPKAIWKEKLLALEKRNLLLDAHLKRYTDDTKKRMADRRKHNWSYERLEDGEHCTLLIAENMRLHLKRIEGDDSEWIIEIEFGEVIDAVTPDDAKKLAVTTMANRLWDAFNIMHEQL
jgi:hypothetical protein